MRKLTIIIFACLAIFVQNIMAATPFPGEGSGTSLDPYKISTAEDLYNVRYFMDAHFELQNDIDISADYPIWLPLGKPEGVSDSPDYEYFSGVFDGKGFTISGVNIEYNERYVGFFTNVSGTIKNLGLIGSVTNNSTKADTGLLTGYLRNTAEDPAIIENCFVDGHIHYPNTADAHVGLLVGRQAIVEASIIRNCHVKGSITGNANYVGGIVGRQGQKTIEVSNCYSEADVSGNNYIGGAIGQIYGDGVSNCYATGTVSGKSSVGGVVGRLYSGSTSSGLVGINSLVEAATSDVGRVIGTLGGTATNLYGLDAAIIKLDGTTETAMSSSTDKDGETKTLAELQNQSLYTAMNWDFDNIWGMSKTTGLPSFKRYTDDMITTKASFQNDHSYQIISESRAINLLGLKWNSQVKVFDSTGKLVTETISTGAQRFELPNKGTYLIEVTHGNERNIIKTISR